MQYQTPYTGSCLCAAVKYRVDRIEPFMGHCHCTMCRKFHGAAFATYGVVLQQNFHWLSGEDHLQQYKAHNGSVRQFCRNCGSSLTFTPASSDGEFIEFALGSLDSPIAEQPDAHIFYEFKANWHEPNDDLPRYAQARVTEELQD